MSAQSQRHDRLSRRKEYATDPSLEWQDFLNEQREFPTEICAIEYWWHLDNRHIRRGQLEAIVEPFLATKKTDNTVQIRGESRYYELPDSLTSADRRTVYEASCALYHLDRLERAMAQSDISASIQATYAFARHDFRVLFCSKCGCTPEEMAGVLGVRKVKNVEINKKRGTGGSKRKGQSKLADYDDELITLYSELRDKTDSIRRICEYLAGSRHLIASTDLVRRRLKHLGVYRK